MGEVGIHLPKIKFKKRKKRKIQNELSEFKLRRLYMFGFGFLVAFFGGRGEWGGGVFWVGCLFVCFN